MNQYLRQYETSSCKTCQRTELYLLGVDPVTSCNMRQRLPHVPSYTKWNGDPGFLSKKGYSDIAIKNKKKIYLKKKNYVVEIS